MRAFRVGLTGGIAAGKSTVSRWLSEAGCEVVDADRLVAELYRPGAPGAAEVERLFGSTLLEADGGVDRPRLAERIFSDPQARRRLEAVIHPLVRQSFECIADNSHGIVVLEATLLVEAGFAPHFDWVVTVEAEPEIRVRRAVERGLTEEAARQRLAAQSDVGTRTAAAHLVLWNNGSVEELRAQVDELILQLERMAACAH